MSNDAKEQQEQKRDDYIEAMFSSIENKPSSTENASSERKRKNKQKRDKFLENVDLSILPQDLREYVRKHLIGRRRHIFHEK